MSSQSWTRHCSASANRLFLDPELSLKENRKKLAFESCALSGPDPQELGAGTWFGEPGLQRRLTDLPARLGCSGKPEWRPCALKLKQESGAAEVEQANVST